MKTLYRLLLTLALCLLASTSVFAQTTPAATPAVFPSYFISTGGSYTRNTTNAAAGWISASIGLGGGNYSITTVDLYQTYSSVRTGYDRIISQSGHFTLLARIDAGIQTGTPVVGNFSGGGILLYDLGAFKSSLTGTYVLAEFRVSGATNATAAAPAQVIPGLFFGFGKSF